MSDSSSNPAQYDWQFFWQVALKHRRVLILANIIALAAALASVPIPLLMPLLVDEVLLDKPAALVGWMNGFFPDSWHQAAYYIGFIFLITVLLRICSMLLGVWQMRDFTIIAKDSTYRIRRNLLGRLKSVSLSEYETLGSGTVASHLVTDLESIDNFIGVTISKFLVAVLTLVGVTAILLWMNWKLALFILVMNPVVIYFSVAMGKRVKDLKKKENKAFELFQQSLTETLDAMQQIRAMNRDKHYIARVVERARGIKEHSANFSWKSDAAARFSFLIFLIGFEGFRAISMLMVVFSNLSIGEMMAVFGYLWFMMTPVQEVLNIHYSFYGAKAALARINRLLDLHQEPQYPHDKNPFEHRTTVGISLRDIHFAYQPEQEILKGVDLDIRPGEKIALVGASGGGKSTMVQVLLGLYNPQQGEVLFDGVPVQEIGLDVVREHCATVLQHPALFNDTVRMNLTLGRDYEEDELNQALEIAQLREVIDELPDGLETLIGRQGVRLSGGQRQRLAIARMVLTRPSVVILDEATSALDSATEARVHEALSDFLRGRTTLIIAHRLSAVKQADRAYVFDDGRIIEEGTHDELIQGEGLYQKLYGHHQ
ncbi:MAG: ABC transporter ATP-binding protein [Gammaproteobacteria bacterium]|nr:ABC transporter ATP-binding protein [Gammaproteobacteria bacterium]